MRTRVQLLYIWDWKLLGGVVVGRDWESNARNFSKDILNGAACRNKYKRHIVLRIGKTKTEADPDQIPCTRKLRYHEIHVAQFCCPSSIKSTLKRNQST